MTTFEPGRIYSGVVHGERRTLIRRQRREDGERSAYPWSSELGVSTEEGVTDVRGPLVVLDLNDDELDELQDALLSKMTATAREISDQIEEQTRPPLQVGWHEVEHSHDWIGRTVRELREGEWYTVPGHRDATQDWTSTHYIGPGSQS